MRSFLPAFALVLVCTLSQAQTYEWFKAWGGASFDIANEMHVDDDGNTYLTGWIKDTVVIGLNTYISEGGQDVLVAKIGSDGTVLWAFSTGGTGNDQGYGIDVDAAGNVYVGGSFNGTFNFGSTTLNAVGAHDVFVAKFNSFGALQWVNDYGSSLDDQANQLSVSPAGSIYVGGNCNNGFTVGSTTLTTQGFDVFVAKISTNGNEIWAENAGGSSTDNLYGMAIDDNENIFITGYLGGSGSFGTHNLGNNGDDDIYVTAVDSAGNFDWAVSHGGTDQEQGQGVTIDNNGNVLVTGYFTSPSIMIGANTFNVSGLNTIFLSRYNASTGAVMSSYSFPSDAGSSAQGVAVDGNGNTYLAGSFRGTLISGNDTVVSLGNSDAMIMAFDSTMQPLCMDGFHSPGFWDIGYGVGTDNDNNVYFSGTYNSGATIDTFAPGNNGAADIFLIKLICDTAGTTDTMTNDTTQDTMTNDTTQDTMGTAIHYLDLINSIKVFPNPASGTLNIDLSAMILKDVEISLINQLGQEVIYRKVSADNRDKAIKLDLYGQPAGIYLLNINSEEGVITRRVHLVE